MLARQYALRILDLRPPAIECEYVAGDATDHAVLAEAAAGVDAVLHCAMGGHNWNTPHGVATAYDVNVKSVHVTLHAARAAGVPHAVYISSMSVYADLENRRLDESVPPDATDLYGLTKRLGEQVCQAAVAEWGLSVNVLRLTWPTPDSVWPDWAFHDDRQTPVNADGIRFQATAATDLARAISAALTVRDGFQLFTISGDRAVGLWSTAKARERLGWEPTFGIRT